MLIDRLFGERRTPIRKIQVPSASPARQPEFRRQEAYFQVGVSQVHIRKLQAFLKDFAPIVYSNLRCQVGTRYIDTTFVVDPRQDKTGAAGRLLQGYVPIVAPVPFVNNDIRLTIALLRLEVADYVPATIDLLSSVATLALPDFTMAGKVSSTLVKGVNALLKDETSFVAGWTGSFSTLKDLLGRSDIITIHIPETAQSKNLVNKSILKHFKKGAILINYARGEVVDLGALCKSIREGHIGGAAVDVFPKEPENSGAVFETPLQHCSNVILTPHIGGSTEEAQQNIGEDVSMKLFNYLEKGITFGSHTVPALALPPQEGSHRILHIHNNVPGVLSEINTQLSKNNINIVGQFLKTNDEIGYVVLDVNKQLSGKALQLLKEVKETIKVRMLY